MTSGIAHHALSGWSLHEQLPLQRFPSIHGDTIAKQKEETPLLVGGFGISTRLPA